MGNNRVIGRSTSTSYYMTPREMDLGGCRAISLSKGSTSLREFALMDELCVEFHVTCWGIHRLWRLSVLRPWN